MKVIDLLNKIANGEEVPKRIKYDEYEYEWDLGLLDYIHKSKQNTISLFDEYICNLCNDLNDEVEIIEENKKIEKLKKCKKMQSFELVDPTMNEQILAFKINEIIEVINNEHNK